MSNLVILTWDFFYWFLLLSKMEEKISWPKDFCPCIVAVNFFCTCPEKCMPSNAPIPLCLYCPDCCCTWVSSAVCMNHICPIKGQTYFHCTVQSVIIIMKNKPKQNSTRYGVPVKIRYSSVSREPAQRFYTAACLSLKSCCSAFTGTCFFFSVWHFFYLVLFFKVMDSFFLLFILIVLRVVVFLLRNPTYLFNLPWQLVVSVNRLWL